MNSLQDTLKKLSKKDILLLAHQSRVITAASLTRIFKHIHTGQSFAFISASTPHNSPTENSKNNTLLQQEVRKLGFGFIKLIGQWESDQKDVDDKPVLYQEDSNFIIGIPLEKAIKLGEKFSQEAIIWGKGDETIGLYQNGRKITEYGTITTLIQDIDKDYSKYKGRKFKFSYFEYIPIGYIDGLSFIETVKEELIKQGDIVNRIICRSV
jgi:hypothetical protein